MNLNKLLKPRTIAIVGASEKAGFGGDTTRNYLKFSKNLDQLYLVQNPGRDTIFNRRAYHCLSEIEGDVDLVILCTPQKIIIPLLEEAAGKNCGGAVVLPAVTVKWAGGQERQRELVEAADRLGIAVMGPNCAVSPIL